MSKQAEEAALKAYPNVLFPFTPLDLNAYRREAFINGYEAAEKDLADKAKYSSGWDGFFYGKGYEQGEKDAQKDLALTWEDIKTIEQIIATSDWYDFEINGKLWSQEFYEEVLKRFKEAGQ